MLFIRQRTSWYRRASKALFFSLVLYRCSRWFLRSVSRERTTKTKKSKRRRNEPLILRYRI